MAESNLDPRLQRLLDKDAIVDLVHRYSYWVDHQQNERVVELFTDDCRVDYGASVAPPIHGKEALRRVFGLDREPGERKRPFRATSHHNANVLVDFDSDDRATVRTSLYAWHETPSGETPRIWAYYYDVAVRTPQGWRLAERVLRVAGEEGWQGEVHPLLP